MIGGLSAGRPQPEDLLSTSEAGDAAVRGGALRVSSFAAGSLLSIAGGALLFRHLGVVDGGRYMTALSLAALVGGLTDLGLSAIGIRELATLEGEKRARLARNLLGIRLVLTTAGVLLVTIFSFVAYGGLLGAGVLIAGAGVLIASVQATYALPLMAELRLGWVSALDLAKQLGSVALIVGLVLIGAGLLSFLAIPAVIALAVLVPTAWLVRGNIPLRPSFAASEWRALIAPVLTYSLAVAAGALYFRIAIVLVSLLSGERQLGYFSLSFRIVEVLLLIPGLLVGSAFPIFARAARDDPERLGYALARVFEVSLIAGAWIALTLAVGAPLAVEIMGGASFAPAAPVLAIQGLGLGASFVAAVWAYGLLSLREHGTILILNVTALVILAAAVAVLATLEGARGAAIATAGVEVAVAIGGALLVVRRRPHLRPSLGVVWKVALAALLGAAPLLVSGVPVGVLVLLSTALYGIALLALRALPRELLVLLPRGRRRP
ncbi:MAG: oligosaccharide flippase family protein [Actinobacteria bacterium]|nr:oligosaccharide flippase family protein [Actinomycetota bacterium]